MSYHDLSETTLDADERREEATRILTRLTDYLNDMTDTERTFVVSKRLRETPVSVKELFWLRDLNSKY